MKIVRIFENNNLLSFKYDGEEKDEFRKLFNLWTDTEFLEKFFNEKHSFLENPYWDSISVEGAVVRTFNTAIDFEEKIVNVSKSKDMDIEFHNVWLYLVYF